MFGRFRSFLEHTPPHVAFILGVTQGLAVAFIIGFFILLNIIMGGGSFNLAKAAKDNNVVLNAAGQPSVPSAEPSGAPVEIKITNSDHVLGSSRAKVTMVEFSDFQCPYCGKFAATVKKLMTDYKDKVRLVYRHFPLDSIHPNARPAAEAAECAGEQGKFWEYHDQLFAKQEELGDATFTQIATNLKLNTAKFNECLASDKYMAKIDADYQSGIAAGVQGTPHSIVNSTPVSGAVPYEQLKAVIDAELKK